jgi:hypothetical protein
MRNQRRRSNYESTIPFVPSIAWSSRNEAILGHDQKDHDSLRISCYIYSTEITDVELHQNQSR